MRKNQKQIRKNPPAPKRARKPKIGRPEGTGYHPTKDQRGLVESLAGRGLPQDQIARLVLNPATGEPISETTLKVHFHNELQSGIAKANATVIGNLFKHTAVHHGAAIFWAKARLKWRDRHPEEPPPPPDAGAGLDPLQSARRVAFMLRAGIEVKIKG